MTEEELNRWWPDEIDMFRALRASPSRKTIDLARTALATIEPLRKALIEDGKIDQKRWS